MKAFFPLCGQVNLNINVNTTNTAENVFTVAELVFMSETKEKKRNSGVNFSPNQKIFRCQ